MECVPEDIVAKKSSVSEERKQKWWDDGLREISHNSVGVLLLAGGQGTRLGKSDFLILLFHMNILKPFYCLESVCFRYFSRPYTV